MSFSEQISPLIGRWVLAWFFLSAAWDRAEHWQATIQLMALKDIPLQAPLLALALIVMIGALNWMTTARLVRAEFLSLKEREFVVAARCIGSPGWRLVIDHLLPNALAPIIVAATVVTFEAIDVAVFVTTFWTPPMSFEIRDCTSPVRVRVKNASDSRCRWR